MLEVRNLNFGYDGEPVLQNVSLTAQAGEITVIVGPNGCGKTTLLKALMGIHSPDSGQVLLDGENLGVLPPRELARRIACLPQNRQVPEITAGRLVLHGRFPYLSYPRHYRREDLAMARKAMETMGIADLEDRMLDTLSGGQRQKVYIAMALAQDTPVILMDEPTNFLDVAHQMQLIREARFLADAGKTVVLVLHDLSMALKTADNLAVLSRGQVLAHGSPEAVYASGSLEKAFGVCVSRIQTPDGWQYYYREGK